MATAVIMPRQGQSVESCLIGKWHKSVGDNVSVGDLLFTYETDKATFEEASKVEGVLLDVFFEEGDDVECLVNVCVIGAEGESVEEFKPASGQTAGQNTEVSKQDTGSTAALADGVSAPVHDSPSNGASAPVSAPPSLRGVEDDAAIHFSVVPDQPQVQRISPRAKRLAEKTRADLRYAVPTGPNGRIIERDVQAVLSQGHRGDSVNAVVEDIVSVAGATGVAGIAGVAGATPAKDFTYGTPVRKPNAPDSEEVTLTNVRKFIAKSMHASLANTAQLTNHSSFDATDVLSFREILKALDGNEALKKITVTDIIVYAVSRVI